jgi:hypothetical protein
MLRGWSNAEDDPGSCDGHRHGSSMHLNHAPYCAFIAKVNLKRACHPIVSFLQILGFGLRVVSYVLDVSRGFPTEF